MTSRRGSCRARSCSASIGLASACSGAGGMGVVVQAPHLELNKSVAIKFLLPDARRPVTRSVERFLREARAAVRIQNEHVARISDVGRLESGVPYMVMEFLEGGDLSAVLQQRGPQPPQLAVDWLLQACEALAEAHALGIVHRDVKPANLFLASRKNGSSLIKVLDFGIAKVIDDDNRAALTSTAQPMGSPLYMSARADALRQARRRAQRYLVAGRGPLRAPVRQPAVRRRDSVTELCVEVMDGRYARAGRARRTRALPAGFDALRRDPAASREGGGSRAAAREPPPADAQHRTQRCGAAARAGVVAAPRGQGRRARRRRCAPPPRRGRSRRRPRRRWPRCVARTPWGVQPDPERVELAPDDGSGGRIHAMTRESAASASAVHAAAGASSNCSATASGLRRR